jgi:transcriptional regulator of acetoin/glycerol metabolism
VALQAHLLRVLQERQVTPLGSSKSVAVDVTIICATHRNLREMIEQKQFREDLFYRLNGLAVKLPPLRERSDLRALARRILDREAPGRRLQMAPEVLTLFEHYHWPGNVRQLFNVLRTAVVMAASDPLITRNHLSDDFLEDAAARLPAAPAAAAAAQAAPAPVAASAPVVAAPPAPVPTAVAAPEVGQTLGDLEIEAIRRAVEAAGGNISEASKRLGVSRNTIYRKLRWNHGDR